MTELLGERLDYVLGQLAERGVRGVRVSETRPVRSTAEPGGTLRVVRIGDEGRDVLAARFPDEVEP